MSAGRVTIAIMAGGKSSRMGTDKAFVPLRDRPLIEHVLERVDGLGDELILITNKPQDFAYLNLPTYGDIFPDHGPLGGLHSALVHASHDYVLVVACDMPWLSRPLLEHMLSLRQTADVIVPRRDRFPEPLHAVYSKACLEPIEASLKANVLKLIAFYGRVKVHFLNWEAIARFDPGGLSFANLNTPEDLAAADRRRPR